jgi:hypothetical protein
MYGTHEREVQLSEHKNSSDNLLIELGSSEIEDVALETFITEFWHELIICGLVKVLLKSF